MVPKHPSENEAGGRVSEKRPHAGFANEGRSRGHAGSLEKLQKGRKLIVPWSPEGKGP